ncbi:MAG: prolipoprotein diacylglyceryl transferase [Micromonosporaceae bacterium]|nr:prolipoprotein diacylglyceryl transferase [Micromonosporaceae bacterium]
MNSLAAIPSPTTAAWPLGPLTLRAYALCIIVGILVACWITERRMRNRGATPYLVLDIAIWAVPGGIIGARIYSLITSPGEYFGKGLSPWEPLEIWHGGLGIWGAVAGGVLGAWIASRNRGIPLTFVMDAAAPALPIAQAIGRWGNWFNNELYGRPTSLPWGVEIHQMDSSNPGHALVMEGQPVVLGTYQPTFLYESVWDIGVAVLVWLLDRRYRFGKGRAFALYVMAYTFGRFWVELLRVDPANHFLGMRVNDWVSILVFVAALLYLLLVRGPQERLEVTESGKLRVVAAPGSGTDAGTDASEKSTTSTASGSTADDDSGGDGESGTAAADTGEDELDDAGEGTKESQPKLRSSAET